MPEAADVMQAWRNVHLVDGAVRGALNKALTSAVGCSLLEHDLLAWLGATPACRSRMLDLAEQLGVTRGGLTRIIDRLVERGWIERDRPERDRREVYAVLTAEGRRAAAQARAVYLDVLTSTLGAHLSERDLLELHRVTSTLLDALTGGRSTNCRPGR